MEIINSKKHYKLLKKWKNDLQGQYSTILPAMLKPYSLDDDTVKRIYDTLTPQKNEVAEFKNMYTEQLHNYQDPDEISVTENSLSLLDEIEELTNKMLNMADTLKEQTIEKLLNKDDLDVAADYLKDIELPEDFFDELKKAEEQRVAELPAFEKQYKHIRNILEEFIPLFIGCLDRASVDRCAARLKIKKGHSLSNSR
jgi:hypothetical protein